MRIVSPLLFKLFFCFYWNVSYIGNHLQYTVDKSLFVYVISLSRINFYRKRFSFRGRAKMDKINA